MKDKETSTVKAFVVVLFCPERFFVDEGIQARKIGGRPRVKFTFSQNKGAVMIGIVRAESFAWELFDHIQTVGTLLKTFLVI